MRQQVVPTGPEASVPPGSNHSCPRARLPLHSSCKCRAHEQGAFPFGWKILEKSRILQTARRWACLLPVSFSARPPADDSSPGTTEVQRPAWDLFSGWRSEERWERNIETSLQVSVLAHSMPTYNPRKQLSVSLLLLKPEWTYKCCCLVAVHVTAAAKLVFRCVQTHRDQQPVKDSCLQEITFGVGDFIRI